MNRLSFFLYSSILNKKIYDEFNEVMGILKDVYVTTENGFPKVIGYKVKVDEGILSCEFKRIDFYQNESGKVRIQVSGSREILPRNYSHLLTKDILDKKIVDVNGRKVVRVEDLRLAEFAGGYRVIAIETGKYVRYRRKGLEGLGRFLGGIFKKDFEERAVMWEDVESLEVEKNNLQVAAPYKRIHQLHPADIADILEEVDEQQRKSIFESLSEDLAADTLEEVEPEVQVSIIKELSDLETAELFENIPNDEIADILDELDQEQREKVLANLESEDAKEVEELLSYSDESIGSIMNKDFISLNITDITVGETLDLLRESKPEEEVMYYIYITDEENRLEGVVSFADLILNKNECKLKDIMKENPISINYTDDISIAAEILSKYNLVSVPVIDEEEKIKGIVLMSDIVDEFFEPLLKKNR